MLGLALGLSVRLSSRRCLGAAEWVKSVGAQAEILKKSQNNLDFDITYSFSKGT